MTLKKSLVLFALILSMVLALAACGVKKSTSETTAKQTTAEETTAKQTTAISETAYEVTYTSARTYKDSIGTVWVRIIFEVTNTGSDDLYLSSGACDLEDSSGNLVASETLISVYPQVISSGEKAYYYEETTLSNVSEALELTVKARPDAVKATVSKRELAVSDVTLQDEEYLGIKALGRVENTLSEETSLVYVTVVLFDAGEKPIGLLYTILTENLAPGAKIGFEASTFSISEDVTSSSVASYKAFAFDFQYQF